MACICDTERYKSNSSNHDHRGNVKQISVCVGVYVCVYLKDYVEQCRTIQFYSFLFMPANLTCWALPQNSFEAKPVLLLEQCTNKQPWHKDISCSLLVLKLLNLLLLSFRSVVLLTRSSIHSMPMTKRFPATIKLNRVPPCPP